jgi:hypothetical protein
MAVEGGIMTYKNDPLERLGKEAEERVTRAMLGGKGVAHLDNLTVQIALNYWMIKSIRQSNEDMVENLESAISGNGKSRRNKLLQQAPATGVGIGIGSVLSLIRQIFS